MAATQFLMLPSDSAFAASSIATEDGVVKSVVAASAELASAVEQASSTGQPVEVESETSETTQVMAHPDGTLALTSHARPVRVKQGGEWRPVDTTLRRNVDGSISPVAAGVDLKFSGGGTDPMLRLADGPASAVELSWPAALPEPTLHGDTATYANVLPEVDLKLIAYPEGYRQVLVVHSAEAASNPALRELRMTTKTTGVALDEGADGELTAIDDNGEELFAGVLPTMWDSSADGPTGSEGTAHSSSPQVHEVAMDVEEADGRAGTGTGEISIMPPHDVLDDPELRYPLFIDPSLGANRDDPLNGSNYMTVHSGGWDYYNNEGEPMRVGYCGWSGCTSVQGKARSYFSLNISKLRGTAAPYIHSATVSVWQGHMAAGCGTMVPTTLHKADSFSSATNWGGPRGAALQTAQAKFDADCPIGGGHVQFNNAAVLNHVRTVVNAGQNSVRFNLSAPNESSAMQWKKFGNNPGIVIVYDAPASVTDRDVEAIRCPSKPTYALSRSPQVSAIGIDNNPVRDKVKLRFEVHNDPSSGAAVRAITSSPWASGTRLGWAVAPELPDGKYALRVGAFSVAYALSTGWSSWEYFTVDKSAPPAPKVVTHDYPAGYWGAPRNAPGRFNLTGASDTAAFSYSFDTASVPSPLNTTCNYNSSSASGGMVPALNGTATITPPSALTPGYHTLHVRAFDHAHNLSVATTSYTFYVSPAFAGVGQNRFEAESITPTQPYGQGDQGNGYPVYTESGPTQSGPTWSGNAQSHLLAPGADEATPSEFNFSFTPASATSNFDAYYALGIQVTTGPNYGKLEFRIDGAPVLANNVDTPFDAYSPTAETQFVTLGGKRLNPGPHTLTVRVVGTNPNSTSQSYTGTYGGVVLNGVSDNGKSVGIDYITAVPINNVNYPSLQAAFNNNGITPEATPGGADIELTSQNKGFSLEALTSAGFGPGATVTSNGVTFQMPSHANEYDNAMAMGQTIAMPTDADGYFPLANAVDLLVTSTCGPTPVGAHVQITMDHDNPEEEGGTTYLNSQIARVPDWLSGETSTSLTIEEDRVVTVDRVADLPHVVTQTGTDPTERPALYHLRVPVVPDGRNMRIKAITLPSVGSDFWERANCGSSTTTPILHVFAIATS